MNRLLKILGITAILASFALVATAYAANPPGQNKLQCFSGTSEGSTYGGSCTMKGNGAKGPATLFTADGSPAGSYAGVYVQSSDLYGKTLSQVKHLQFNYDGTAVTAGAPRFSVPLDTNGDGMTDVWAFASAYYCNNGNGTVNVINDSTCTIYAGTESFNNWASMAAAHPTWTIADDQYVFIIADEPGTWTVSGVQFGK